MSTNSTRVRVVFLCVLLSMALACLGCAGEDMQEKAQERQWRLVKATISDCTSSYEEDSELVTSDALLEGVSFAQNNPFFLNISETLAPPCALPIPTTSYIEKCEWTYDDEGLPKSATMYKSTNELSTVTLSYDSHGSISKVIGSVTEDEEDDNGFTEHDFEISVVNESLGSDKCGPNKYTVVHSDSTNNDTVLFVYDKDKNLTSVTSSGKHSYDVEVEYVTAFKVPKEIRMSMEGEDGQEILIPTYDADNKLVMLETQTEIGKDVTEGPRYEIQYSGKKYSKMRVYDGDAELYYCDFSYNEDGCLSTIRAYTKNSVQMYVVSFTWES